MFEVVIVGNRWTWRLTCAAGRALVWTDETFETDKQAAEAVRAYRAGFWFVADQVDHRQARCV